MNKEQQINLKKMMKEFDVTDQTENIRNIKHSAQIRTDVEKIIQIQKENHDMSHETLDAICLNSCFFLFTNYTDIYNRLLKKELNITILFKIIDCLQKIENGNCDQQEASFEVGTLLKKMYIDSALKKADKQEEQYSQPSEETTPPKNISWKNYKKNIG